MGHTVDKWGSPESWSLLQMKKLELVLYTTCTENNVFMTIVGTETILQHPRLCRHLCIWVERQQQKVWDILAQLSWKWKSWNTIGVNNNNPTKSNPFFPSTKWAGALNLKEKKNGDHGMMWWDLWVMY